MRFAIFASALALATTGQATVAPKIIIDGIRTVTDLSSQTFDILARINIFNFYSNTPKAINNVRIIITKVNNLVIVLDKDQDNNGNNGNNGNNNGGDNNGNDNDNFSATSNAVPGSSGGSGKSGFTRVVKRQGGSPYSQEDKDAICNALAGFIKVHQALLSIFIGKSSVFANTPFVSIIAGILRTLEGLVDRVLFALLALGGCGLGDEKDALDQTFISAINSYSG